MCVILDYQCFGMLLSLQSPFLSAAEEYLHTGYIHPWFGKFTCEWTWVYPQWSRFQLIYEKGLIELVGGTWPMRTAEVPWLMWWALKRTRGKGLTKLIFTPHKVTNSGSYHRITWMVWHMFMAHLEYYFSWESTSFTVEPFSWLIFCFHILSLLGEWILFNWRIGK